MDEFTLDRVIIGEKALDRLTDAQGTHWYPLKSFLVSILCKYDKISSFRDSAMARYMRVIEYYPDRPGMRRLAKMWCMNENGIKYLLRNMKVVNYGNKNLYSSRQKGFYEACRYFNVSVPDDIDPKYINTTPNLKNYDIWSVLCIENDWKLKGNDRWKKCAECNYYYPDKARYFGGDKKTKKICLQCQGLDFKCQNKHIQYIYEHNGLDLLYKLTLNNNEDVVEALKAFINRGGANNEN